MSRINKDSDNCNIPRLVNFKLPVIKSINQLLEIFEISEKEEKMFFYSQNRKTFLYKTKNIPKRKGGYRVLEIPNDKLMAIQKSINKVVLSRFKMSKSCTSYIKGKSIINNAVPHVKSKSILKFDIQDFFPSIRLNQIVAQFRYFGYGKNVSRYLGYLCVNNDFSLPQGAPTSPMLSNLVCIKLDVRLERYCEKHNYRYTRYADDITISSLERLEDKECEKIKSFVYMVLEEEGFIPNHNKYLKINNGQLMTVTGIVVNDKTNAIKSKHRELDNAIRYIEKYGLKNHLEKINCSKLNYKQHLFGLANYIKMINFEKGNEYIQRLKSLNFYED